MFLSTLTHWNIFDLRYDFVVLNDRSMWIRGLNLTFLNRRIPWRGRVAAWGHLFAASTDSSAEGMWMFWQHSTEKREEIAYLWSSSRHIMFQRTPLPLSRFPPTSHSTSPLTHTGGSPQAHGPWRIRGEDGWLSRAPQAPGGITSVTRAAEKLQDIRLLATVNSLCCFFFSLIPSSPPLLIANIHRSITEKTWQRWKKRADLRKIKEAANQLTRWKGK